jgi:hypothetical protein
MRKLLCGFSGTAHPRDRHSLPDKLLLSPGRHFNERFWEYLCESYARVTNDGGLIEREAPMQFARGDQWLILSEEDGA